MKISSILEGIKSAQFRFIGNEENTVTRVVQFKVCNDHSTKDAIAWTNEKNAELVSGELTAGLLILNDTSYRLLEGKNCNFLITDQPRLVFLEILRNHFSQKHPSGVEGSTHIHPSVTIGDGSYIGHNVVIEQGCNIGSNCEILHNTVIFRDTQIGNNVRIGSNCSIGNFGFGYEKDVKGEYHLMEHLGNVIIKDDVHIHNNTCIDRAVIGSTVIWNNVKIDNLVHIAHGVQIHSNSLIIANAMVAGSVTIGENSWIAPSTSIKNQLNIAASTMTGIGTIVLKNTKSDETVIGNPAVSIEEYRKWSKIRKNMMDS